MSSRPTQYRIGVRRIWQKIPAITDLQRFDGEKQSGYNRISDSTVFFLFSRPGLPKNDVM